MQSLVFSYILGLLLLFGGTRNHTDLLDTLSTDLYWQIKNIHPDLAQLRDDAGPDAAPQNIDPLLKDLESEDFATRDKAHRALERMGPAIVPQLKPAAASKDAEVAAVAADLLRKFTGHEQERAIRRLMAIRTLGERKEKAALPLLQSLTDSKLLFVADYARRALAQIEGKPYVPADLYADLQKDVALLPAETAIIAQGSGLNSESPTIASLVDQAVDAANGGPNFLLGGPPPERKLDKKLVLMDMSRRLLDVIEHVGDVRLDAITFGYRQTQDDDAQAILILRGVYDSKVMYEALKPLIRDEAADKLPDVTGDIPMLTDGRNSSMLFPNDRQMVVVYEAHDHSAARNALLAALRGGKGGIDQNKDLAALIKGIDTRSPFWAAGKLTDYMRKDGDLGAISTFTLESKAGTEAVDFTGRALGDAPEKMKTLVDTVNDGVKSTATDIQREMQAMPGLQPLVDLVSSIKVTAQGNSATMVCRLKPDILNAAVSTLGPMIIEELQPRESVPPEMVAPINPPANQPAPDVLPNPIENKGK